jgi:thiol-disulfide isomerase/thioredoxin
MHRPLAVALVLALACGHAAFPPSAASPLLGQPLHAIHRRQTLDGAAFDASQFAGRTVLVKFFAEYCKPCRETLPAAERVHQARPEVAFLGVDEDDSEEVATSLVRGLGITFPVVVDTANVLSGRFRVASMPATFVADATGVIRWVGGEDQSEDDLLRAVDAAR